MFVRIPEGASQLFRVFLIACFGRHLFNPFVKSLDLCFLFFVGSHVLVQCFLKHRVKSELVQPGNILYGPFGSGILMPCRKTNVLICCFSFLRASLWSSLIQGILFNSIIFSGGSTIGSQQSTLLMISILPVHSLLLEDPIWQHRSQE